MSSITGSGSSLSCGGISHGSGTASTVSNPPCSSFGCFRLLLLVFLSPVGWTLSSWLALTVVRSSVSAKAGEEGEGVPPSVICGGTGLEGAGVEVGGPSSCSILAMS